MSMRSLKTLVLLLLAARCLLMGEAQASLTVSQTFVGNYAVSTDGWGALDQSGTIEASVPAGATVVGAYLYTSTYGGISISAAGGTLNGIPVTYTSLGQSNPALTAGRTDVTDIVKAVINGGPGGTYGFAITETSAQQGGSALVVVYQKPDLPYSTVGIMDGFSQSTGDSATINFATPLAPAAPGFFAELRLGIGHSFGDQTSRIRVNGTTITENAGNFDDGTGFIGRSGTLITVGGFNDPFSALLPSYDDDHERYNLMTYTTAGGAPIITAGDTSIFVETNNPSRDDNLFLAVFHVAGTAPQPTAIPTLSQWGMILLSALMVLGTIMTLRRRRL
jgi:IPTL-CTERM motif